MKDNNIDSIIGDRTVDVEDVEDIDLFADFADDKPKIDDSEDKSTDDFESSFDLFTDLEDEDNSSVSNFSFDDLEEEIDKEYNQESIYEDDEDIHDETTEFIKTLTNTIKYMLKPSTDEIDGSDNESYKTGYNRKIVSKSKMKKQVNTMKEILDLVQKYNRDDKRDKSVLPGNLAETVSNNQLIVYDNKEDTVWNVVRRTFVRQAKGNVALLNKINDNIIDLKRIFGLLCETYSDADSEYFDIKRSKPINDKINKKRFAFYYGCLQRLNNEDVALCRRIIFDKYDKFRYKFICGNCGREVVGGTELELDDGTIVEEDKNNHNFYKVLIVNGIGLHYPLICEECGAINCLPMRIRNTIDEQIKVKPTESSNDKKEYVSNITNTTDKSVSDGINRSVPYAKWLDMLEYEIKDGEFSIDSGSVFENENELIVEVNYNDYVEAIRSFRDLNRVHNKKRSLEKNGVKDIDYVLAIISSHGRSTVLRDVCDMVASYIIDSETFRHISELKEDKERCYDSYIKYTAIRANLTSQGLSQQVVENISLVNSIDINVDTINKLCDDNLYSYLDYKENYDSLVKAMIDNYKSFSFMRRDKKKNALQILCDTLGNTDECYDFILKCICEALFVEAFNNLMYSFSMKVSGVRISSRVSIKRSKIQDKEHLRSSRYNMVKSYLSELVKSDGGVEPNSRKKYSDMYKEIGKIMSAFDSDFCVYQKYCEWRDMFSLSDNDSINDLKSMNNSDAIFKVYNQNMCSRKDDYSDDMVEHFAGKKLSVLKPDFIHTSYFRVIFNIDDSTPESVINDSVRAFNIIIGMKEFKAYDVIFSKLMRSYIGLRKFTGFNTSDVALNLNMSNGSVVRMYEDCVKQINKFIGGSRKFYNTALRLSNHEFVLNSNYPANMSAFSSYINELKEVGYVSTDTLEDLSNCIDRAKIELNSAAYVDDEFYFRDIV